MPRIGIRQIPATALNPAEVRVVLIQDDGTEIDVTDISVMGE